MSSLVILDASVFEKLR